MRVFFGFILAVALLVVLIPVAIGTAIWGILNISFKGGVEDWLNHKEFHP